MCALVGASSPLQGDEHHDFAFTHRIKTFQEKVIVYRPCRRVPCRVLTARKFRNKHRHIDKRILEIARSKWFMNGFSIFSKPCTLTFFPGCRCSNILPVIRSFSKVIMSASDLFFSTWSGRMSCSCSTSAIVLVISDGYIRLSARTASWHPCTVCTPYRLLCSPVATRSALRSGQIVRDRISPKGRHP